MFALVPILFILLLCPGAVFCSRRWETPARLRQPKSPASPQGPRSGWLAPGGQAKRPDSRAAPPFCILFRGDGGRSSFGNKREAARVRQGALIVLLLHLDLFRFCELGLSSAFFSSETFALAAAGVPVTPSLFAGRRYKFSTLYPIYNGCTHRIHYRPRPASSCRRRPNLEGPCRA